MSELAAHEHEQSPDIFCTEMQKLVADIINNSDQTQRTTSLEVTCDDKNATFTVDVELDSEHERPSIGFDFQGVHGTIDVHDDTPRITFDSAEAYLVDLTPVIHSEDTPYGVLLIADYIQKATATETTDTPVIPSKDAVVEVAQSLLDTAEELDIPILCDTYYSDDLGRTISIGITQAICNTPSIPASEQSIQVINVGERGKYRFERIIEEGNVTDSFYTEIGDGTPLPLLTEEQANNNPYCVRPISKQEAQHFVKLSHEADAPLNDSRARELAQQWQVTTATAHAELTTGGAIFFDTEEEAQQAAYELYQNDLALKQANADTNLTPERQSIILHTLQAIATAQQDKS